ncbi:MAG: M56 family metallopeptidase [bacterium]|jgi:beta-lactamase regulating signal transducer with metallopeptidase domain
MWNEIGHLAELWYHWIWLSLPGMMLIYPLAELIVHFGNRIPAQVRYWILLLILLKCLFPTLYTLDIPVLPAGEAGVPSAVMEHPLPQPYLNESAGYQEFAGNSDGHISAAELASDTFKPLRFTVSTHEILFLLSIIGSVVIICITGIRVLRERFTRTCLADEDLGALCGRVCVRLRMRMPGIFVSASVQGPYAGGLFSPYLVVPESILVLPDNQKELILAHELVHVQRLDYLVTWFQLAVTILMWWNPIILRLNYLIRCEREYCVDDRVLQIPDVQPLEYSRMLLKAAERQVLTRQFQWQTALTNPTHSFQHRIRRIIMNTPIQRNFRIIGNGIAVMLLLSLIFDIQISRAIPQRNEPGVDVSAHITPAAGNRSQPGSMWEHSFSLLDTDNLQFLRQQAQSAIQGLTTGDEQGYVEGFIAGLKELEELPLTDEEVEKFVPGYHVKYLFNKRGLANFTIGKHSAYMLYRVTKARELSGDKTLTLEEATPYINRLDVMLNESIRIITPYLNQKAFESVVSETWDNTLGEIRNIIDSKKYSLIDPTYIDAPVSLTDQHVQSFVTEFQIAVDDVLSISTPIQELREKYPDINFGNEHLSEVVQGTLRIMSLADIFRQMYLKNVPSVISPVSNISNVVKDKYKKEEQLDREIQLSHQEAKIDIFEIKIPEKLKEKAKQIMKFDN